jgi:NAD+-dependent secondary alcohol dehydrogenase Adh1
MRAALLRAYHEPLELIERPEPEIEHEKTVQANLVGTWPDLYELIQLHARGRLQLRVETHPLHEINVVLDKLRAGEVTGRAVVVPD